MKDAILLELADRWDREAKGTGEAIDANAVEYNIRQSAYGECQRECADTIRTLISMLGE
jgi:hypothetical protein